MLNDLIKRDNATKDMKTYCNTFVDHVSPGACQGAVAGGGIHGAYTLINYAGARYNLAHGPT